MSKNTILPILTLLLLTASLSAQPLRAVTYETMIETADASAEKYDYAGAIEWYGKAYDISKDKNLKVAIGDLYMKLRDYKKAQRNYERAMKRDKTGEFEFLRIDLAKSMKFQGNYKDAISEFRTVEATTEDDTLRQMAKFEIDGILSTEDLPQNIETIIGFAGKEVNTGSGENSPTAYNDGSLYFSSFNRNKTILLDGEEDDFHAKIYSSTVDGDGKYGKPDELNEKINRPGYNSGGVSFSPDGKTMYFTRNELEVNELLSSKIYVSRRGDTDWISADELENVNGDWLALHPFEGELFGDKVLYFVSDMDGGYGGKDIYYSKMTGDNFGPPVNLGPKINTTSDDITPFYQDGTLYFSTNGKPGFGGFDIHYTSWNGEAWSDPINMGHNYNTAQDEMYLRFASDGSGGFLVSNRPDKNKKKLKGSETCCDDIFVVNLRELVIDLIAKVTDEEGTPLAEATIELVRIDAPEGEDAESKTNVTSNEFNFLLDGDSNYKLVVSKDGYYPDTLTTFNTIGILDDYTVKKTIALKAKPVVPEIDESETIVVDAYEPIRLNNIYYDFDKATIQDNSFDDLDYLKELMDQYPDMVIELSAHTDSRGPKRYNRDLSDRRAKEAAKYLKKQGISAKRVVPKGYGETRILNGCVDKVDCNEDQHQENRRTEFKVLSGPQFITIKKKITGGKTPSSGNQSNDSSGKQSFETKPVMTFELPIQNLGKLIKGESKDLEYYFTNTGNEDLIIELVTTCKCTEITWPKEPIKPGEGGVITATYHTKDQKIGPIEKSIDIVANTDPIVVEAKFVAEILPTSAKKTK